MILNIVLEIYLRSIRIPRLLWLAASSILLLIRPVILFLVTLLLLVPIVVASVDLLDLRIILAAKVINIRLIAISIKLRRNLGSVPSIFKHEE